MRRAACHGAVTYFKKRVLWDYTLPSSTARFRKRVAGRGSCPRAKCGGVRKENRASLAPSQTTDAGSPRMRRHRKPCYQPVVRRLLLGSSLARSRHSTLVGGNPPLRCGAEGPDLGSGSPPSCRTQLATAGREPPDRASDAAAGPRKSNRKEDKGNVEHSLARPLPDRHSADNIHGGGRSPDNRGDRPAEIL